MRARSIQPGFFNNEQLAECDPLARLLFIGLWCAADRKGRLEDRPLRLKIQIFPSDNIDTKPLLDQLEANGLIHRYEVDGKKLIWIPTFLKHQRPHYNERGSQLPPSDLELSQQKDNLTRVDQLVTKVESTFDQGNNDLLPRSKALRSESLSPESLSPESLNTRNVINNTSVPFAEAETAKDTPKLPPNGGEGEDHNDDLKVDSCPYEKIVALYNAAIKPYPYTDDNGDRQGPVECQRLTNERRKALHARWGEAKERQTLSWWENYINSMMKCDFLIGRARGSNGKFFKLEFKHVVREEFMTRFFEGKYNNHSDMAYKNFDALRAEWNRVMSKDGFPPCLVTTDRLVTAYQDRKREHKDLIAKMGGEAVFWHKLMENITASNYLCGKTESRHSPVALEDIITNAERFAGVISGKYIDPKEGFEAL